MSLHHHPPRPPELALNEREQIQYLLSNPPSWMMRYGISAMAVFFVGLLALSYFIRYPDVVEAKITLTTAHPPIRVMAAAGGPVSALLVSDGQTVAQGQVLAVFENPAQWQDVLRLEAWAAQDGTPTDSLPQGLRLGDLQSVWSVLSQHWKDYHYFSTNHNTTERIAALERQIGQLRKMNDSHTRQKVLLKKEFELATKERNRQSRLHAEQVIADLEFEKSEATWLQQKRQVETAEAATLQNEMQVQALQNQITELRLTRADHQNDKTLALNEDLQRLRSAIVAWKQNTLVIAPIAGQVSFSKIWSVQQHANAGEEILAIVPAGDNSSEIIGKAKVAGTGLGKIKPDHRAIIRLDAWPVQQYGTVEGRIQTITALPQEEGQYGIDVALPHALRTSYHKDLPFRQEMSGSLRIITEDRRVIDRVFDRLQSLLKN
jgi:multidrug resistance efflux pump